MNNVVNTTLTFRRTVGSLAENWGHFCAAEWTVCVCVSWSSWLHNSRLNSGKELQSGVQVQHSFSLFFFPPIDGVVAAGRWSAFQQS